MKLRIRGNSIRFRLGRSEVRRLAAEGVVEEFTDFGPPGSRRLGYGLHAALDGPGMTAQFEDGRLTVGVPVSDVRKWARTDVVGIYGRQRISEHGELQILIEKDFQCLDSADGEADEDAFVNPQSAACAGSAGSASSGSAAAVKSH